MAKKATVSGIMLTSIGKDVSREDYTADFIVESDTESEARCVIRRGYIEDHLRKTVKNFKRVYTMQVDGLDDVKEESKNSDLDKLQLEAANLGCVPENLANIKRQDYKANALKKAIDAHNVRMEKAAKKNAAGQGT